MSRRAKLEQMLSKQPADPFLHYGLAMELAKEGQIAEALNQFEQTLKLDSGYIAVYFQQANLLAGQGRTDEAKTTLQSGIEIARQKNELHSADEMQSLLDSLT
jgi:tetratricopeptide (TPR) repeat protein